MTTLYIKFSEVTIKKNLQQEDVQKMSIRMIITSFEFSLHVDLVATYGHNSVISVPKYIIFTCQKSLVVRTNC